MKDPKDLSPDFSDLRRRAEERLEAEAVSAETLSPAEAARLIHELQVHQIELELQNEELRQAQVQLAEYRDKYADLYDFAPVGYLTLNKAGKILEANLITASMLGRERSKILGLYFPHFLVDADRRVFRQLLNNSFDQPERRGEFHLQDGNGDVRVLLLDILFLKDAEGRERRRVALTDITELKRTQEELRLHKEELEELVAERTAELIEANEQLRESNDNLRALFEAAPLAIGVFDAEGKALTINTAVERIFGWSKEELEGRMPRSMPTEAPEESLAVLQGVLQGEFFTGVEVKQQRKDGTLIDVSLSAAPLHNAEGHIRGFIGLAEDITERKRTEEAVRTQARVLESMAEAVTVTDHRGHILYTNPAFDAMFGYKPGELLGRHSNILNFYPPEENTRVVKEILHQVNVTGVWSGEFHNCKKTGHPFYTSAHISALEVGGKKLFISVQEDITERKRVQEALRTSEERLSLAFKATNDGIWDVDIVNRTVWWNDAYNVLFGERPDDTKGNWQWWADHLHPEDREWVLRSFIKAVREGPDLWVEEYRYQKTDGTYTHVYDRGLVARDDSGRAVRMLGAMQDITERKRAEEMLRRQAELLDLAHDAIVVRDPKGRITYWNQGATKHYGWPKEVALGKNYYKLFKTAFPQPLPELERLLLKQGYWEGELAHTNFQGKRLVMNSRWSLKRDDEGRVAAILEISQDVTAQKQIEKEVHRLASFPLLNPSPVLEADDKGKVIYANLAARKASENLRLAEGVNAFLPPDLKKFMAAARKGGPREYSFDKELGEAIYTITLHLPHDLPTVRLYATEITERERSKKALEESLSLYKATLESTADGLLVVDRQGRMVSWNRKFMDMWPMPEDIWNSQDEEQGLAFILDQLADPEVFLTKVREVYANPEAEDFDVIHFKDGRVYERYSLPQYLDHQIVGRVWSFRDVTARVKAEQALIESRQDLNRAQAVALIGSWRLDVRKNELTWSDENHRIFGIAKGTPLTYESFLAIVHPEDREFVDQKWMGALRGEAYDIEHRIVVNGQVKWVRERAELELDDRGQLSGGFGTTQDITVHRRAEEALRESEERYRSLFENSHTIMLLIDPETGDIVDANPAACGYYGFSREELLTQKITDLNILAPKEVFQEMRRAQAEERQYFEFRHRLASGEVRDVEMFSGPIQIKGRDLLYAILHDDTARKQAEAALRESEARFRSLFESMAEGVALHEVIFDDRGRAMDYRILATNPAYTTHTGLKPEQVQGQLASRAYGTGEAPYLEDFARVAELGEPVSFETFFTPLQRHFAISVTSPKAGHFVSVFEDITERKRMEEVLAGERALLQTIIETIPVMIGIYDPNIQSFYLNRAFHQITGWTKEDADRNNIMELAHPDPEYRRSIVEYMQSLQPGFKDIQMVAKDGSIIESSWANMKIPDKRQVGIGIDITERKQAEAALQRQHDLLQGMNRILHAALTCEKEEDLGRTCLAVAEELTGSKFGFIGEINQAGLLDDIAISDLGWSACKMAGSAELVLPQGLHIHGIYGRVLKEGQSVFANDPATHPDSIGTPEGHPPLTAFLGVPLKEGNKTIGMVGLGNKAGGYDQADQGAVETLSVAMVEAFQRLRAEEALIQSEARYRAIGELIPYGIWMAGSDGGYQYLSQSFLKLTGKTLEECQEFGWMQLLPQVDIKPTLAAWQYCLETGGFWDYEHKIRGKDGRYHTILSRGLPLADSQGRITSWVGINLDISERKEMEEALRRAHDELEERVAERTAALRLTNEQLLWEIEERQEAEERLRESEARFTAFMKHLPGLAVMRDVQGRYIFANEAWEQIMGKTRKDWQGKPLKEIWPQEMARRYQELDQQVLLAGEPMEVLETLEMEDGLHHLLFHRFPIRDQDGLPYMVGAIGIDVTARQRAEEALAVERQRFFSLLDNLPAFVYLQDQNYSVRFANRQFRERFGEPNGRTCYTLLWGRESPCPECPSFKVFHTGEPVDREWQSPDGRTYQIYDYPFEDVDGSPLVLEMGIDITAKKQAEEEARHQTRLFEAFFDHAITPLVFLDPHFNFIRVNRAYALACHREVGEFAGHNYFDLFPSAARLIFEEVIASKTSTQAEAWPFKSVNQPDWETTFWDLSLTPILDEAGEVNFLVYSLKDVTEQVHAEEERRRLVDILENTPDFVGIADFYGQLQYLNRAGRAMVGVGQDEDVSQLRVLQLHPGWVGELILEEGSPVARREGVWQMESALLHRDGREIPVSQVILAHKDPAGRVQFFSTVARDISDLKQAQESILRQANILNGINLIFREALTRETPEELGRTCLTVAEELTDSRFGFISELNEEGTFDTLAFGDPGWDLCRIPNATEPTHLKDIKPVGLLAETVREGKTVLANDPSSHPDTAGTPAGHPPLTAYLGVPLISGDRTIGLIGLGNKPGGYSTNDQQTVETLAPSIVEALMHHQAQKDLQRSESKLRHLADQLLTAQESERKRLAVELHDELGHALLTMKLVFSSIDKKLLPEQKDIKEEIQEQLAYINDVIGEVRRLYQDLSPGDVEDLGLTKGLQTLIEDFAAHQPHITWKVDLPALEGLFSQPVQTIIYRLVQEALTNIGKHANPEHVNISAVNEGAQVHFTIWDDGTGFDMIEVLESASGLGLVAMEERLNMLGGSFVVWSKRAEGTRLSFSIPTLPEDER